MQKIASKGHQNIKIRHQNIKMECHNENDKTILTVVSIGGNA
jgi:hypothetical protein